MDNPRLCAFLTMEDTNGFSVYDHLTVEPLAQLGWQVVEVPWNRADVTWDDFDLVVIRSTWDYQDNPREFMRVLEQIYASSARLENPLEIIRWNVEKTYLKDMQDRGVPIVPTEWLSGLDESELARLYGLFGSGEFIVKPIVGANADDTFRLAAGGSPDLVEAATQTFSSRRLMAQPFIASVLEEGEYSLFYFGGRYSHCIRKTPKRGDFRVQEEYGGLIQSVVAGPDLLAAGQMAIDAIGQQLLYARVDLVRLPSRELVLMELELIEPSLYFANDPQAPSRFARQLAHMHG